MTRSAPAATGVVTAPTSTGFASVPGAEAAGSGVASPVGGRPARCCTCAAYRCHRLLAVRQLRLPRLAEARPVNQARVRDILEDRHRVPARLDRGPVRPGVGEHRVLIVETVALDHAERLRHEAVAAHPLEIHDQESRVQCRVTVSVADTHPPPELACLGLLEHPAGALPFTCLADRRVAGRDRSSAQVHRREAADVVERQHVDIEVDDPGDILEECRKEQPVHRRDRDPGRHSARQAAGAVADLVARQERDRQGRERPAQPLLVRATQSAGKDPEPERPGRVLDDGLDQDRGRLRQVLVVAHDDVGDGRGIDPSCGPNRRLPARLVATAAAMSMVVAGSALAAVNRDRASATRDLVRSRHVARISASSAPVMIPVRTGRPPGRGCRRASR